VADGTGQVVIGGAGGRVGGCGVVDSGDWFSGGGGGDGVGGGDGCCSGRDISGTMVVAIVFMVMTVVLVED